MGECFFWIGQFLLWKGKYLQFNDLQWVSVFFNWAIFVVEKIIEAKWLNLKWFLFNLCLKKLLFGADTNHTQKTLRLCSLSSSWLCVFGAHTHTHTDTHKKERIIELFTKKKICLLVVKNWQFYLHQAHEYHHHLFGKRMH